MNIAVFCSGNGSNFQAIVDASKKGLFDAKIVLMVCDNPKAFAIERAAKEGVKTYVLDKAAFSSKEKHEAEIIKTLEKENIGLICLAGYMRLLLPSFIQRYRNRIINVHPALLPMFKGTHAIRDAIEHGVDETGVTVHFVTEKMDSGPIILQEKVKVEKNDTEDLLAERIHKVEHRVYPEAIKLFVDGRLEIKDEKVTIKPA